MSTRIFALIIGIDSYKSGGIWNLHSCVEDAKKVKRWLMDGLNVPRDQICLLLDSHATKQKIEDSFMEHLTNNPSIETGDAILIYFAGHGSCLPAPSGWYPSQCESKTETVEVLCPYDHDTKASQGRIAGISDRSLQALIHDLTSSKGNNITLLLDCCFSPLQTPPNIRDRSITRWTMTTKAVPDDLYCGLWSTARGKPRISKLGFFQPEASHIVLAACSPGEKAIEGKEGGRFTTSLLQAASVLPLHRTSYTQFINHLRQATGDSQGFVCLGKHKDRVLFDDVPFPPDNRFSLASLDKETRLMKVGVGAIHGIVAGSEFSLHLHNHRCSHNPSIASLVVSDVHPSWCFARVKSQASALPKSCWAKITRWNNRRPFHVYLKSTFNSFIRMWKLRKTLPSKPDTISPKNGLNVLRVKRPDLADISLILGTENVVIIQHNPILIGASKRLEIEKRSGNEVIDDAARFNLHLLRKNIDNPLRNLVDMELHRLDPHSWSKISPNYLRDETATVPYERGAIYQVTLHNKSKIDIWPYIAYMDPSRYSITMIYSSNSSNKAPLRSEDSLEIGSGRPGSEALTFSLDDHNHFDCGYLKIFLSSAPVSMKVLEQDPLPHWTHDIAFQGDLPAESKPSIPVWDTVLATLIFIRHPDGNP
ncbi:caspase domain-containing protein [Flammula alnicola]|nr:caspase domain-containing protein [Flammula alnicola]